jgi:hypothetical protein
VLQTDRDRKSHTVHEAGERGAFFGHFDEDFAGRPFRVHAYSDVAFVTTYRELVRNGFPFIGELAALGACEQVLLFRRPRQRTAAPSVFPARQREWLRVPPDQLESLFARLPPVPTQPTAWASTIVAVGAAKKWACEQPRQRAPCVADAEKTAIRPALRTSPACSLCALPWPNLAILAWLRLYPGSVDGAGRSPRREWNTNQCPLSGSSPTSTFCVISKLSPKRAGAQFAVELHNLRKTGASRRYLAGVPLNTLMLDAGDHPKVPRRRAQAGGSKEGSGRCGLHPRARW